MQELETSVIIKLSSKIFLIFGWKSKSFVNGVIVEEEIWNE